jgi:hypothetical protein
VNLGALLPYAVLSIVGFLVCARMTGRPLSLMFRHPTRWDILSLAFAVYIPVVWALIPNGLVAGVVVTLTAVALSLFSRRYGPNARGSDVRPDPAVP